MLEKKSSRSKAAQTKLIVLLAWLLSGPVFAHHSALAYFNMAATAEIEGVVTSVHWRNPHIRFSLEVIDESNQQIEWDVELSALSMFRNRGYNESFIEVGDRVEVYGNPAHRGRPAMSGLNMLLPDGIEVVLEASADPYYGLQNNAQVLVASGADAEAELLARESADGIFRVWSTPVNDPHFPVFRGDYPLTEYASRAKSEWVANEEVLEGCWAKSMPYMMVTPAPIEFVRAGENIQLRFEEEDAQRLIYMNAGSGSHAEETTGSIYGHSIGVWEGETLVVETSNLNSPNFDDRGTPQSEEMRVIERFTPTDNGERLEYEIGITDPVIFTDSLDFVREFVWRAERTIDEWDCEA